MVVTHSRCYERPQRCTGLSSRTDIPAAAISSAIECDTDTVLCRCKLSLHILPVASLTGQYSLGLVTRLILQVVKSQITYLSDGACLRWMRGSGTK